MHPQLAICHAEALCPPEDCRQSRRLADAWLRIFDLVSRCAAELCSRMKWMGQRAVGTLWPRCAVLASANRDALTC